MKKCRRKNFNSLQSKTSKARRLNEVLKDVEEDDGIEKPLLEKLLMRNEQQQPKPKIDEELCCLNVISTLNISLQKWDDLRFWLTDVISRGMDRQTVYEQKYKN